MRVLLGMKELLSRPIGAIQSSLYHIIRHPGTWQRIQKEIAAEQLEGRCRDAVISFADTQNLPYFRYSYASLKFIIKTYKLTGIQEPVSMNRCVS